MTRPRATVALPHVRVETRRVYVGARGATLGKHAAYVRTAKQVVADHCKCGPANLSADPFSDAPWVRCRLHAVCCDERTEGRNDCEHSYPMPYYRRVVQRLAWFLKFVDARHAAAQKGRAA